MVCSEIITDLKLKSVCFETREVGLHLEIVRLVTINLMTDSFPRISSFAEPTSDKCVMGNFYYLLNTLCNTANHWMTLEKFCLLENSFLCICRKMEENHACFQKKWIIYQVLSCPGRIDWHEYYAVILCYAVIRVFFH